MIRLFLLMLFLTGCAPALTFRFEGPVTTEQAQATASAMSKWNAVTVPDKKMKLSAKGQYTISFPEQIPTASGMMDGRECTHSGPDCPDAPSIRVRAGLAGARLFRVVKHELAHALGMKHITTPGGLMTPGAEGSETTAADMAECRRVKSCP